MGCAPNSAGEAYSAPIDPVAVLKKPTSKGGRRYNTGEERGGKRGREGSGEERRECGGRERPVKSVKPTARKVAIVSPWLKRDFLQAECPSAVA